MRTEDMLYERRALGFAPLTNMAPAFADVKRGNLRLLLSDPDRIHPLVEDIAAEVERLRAAGLPFRNDIVRGPGGAQIVLEDPSGNPIELFQPAKVPVWSRGERA